jgi:signal transduction histidine kinase
LELTADAEHELRGPLTVLALLCARMQADASTRAYAHALDAQLARLRAGLEDLAAARRGRRAPGRMDELELRSVVDGAAAAWGGRRSDWRAGDARVVADPGRLAQALGNLVANAHEHGDGDVAVSGRTVPGAVRVEVRNRHADRGRGLRIASEAAAAAGGRLELKEEDGDVVAALELPLADPPIADAA